MQRVEASFTEKAIALAMVTSVWTSVRIGSVFGISEFIILLILVLKRSQDDTDIEIYHAAQDKFLTALLVLMPLGLVWNIVTVRFFAQTFHDLFAMLYIFVMTRLFNRQKFYNNILGILYWFFLITAVMNVYYYRMYSAGMGFYVYGERFQGLGTDPNQLAEALFLAPWLGLYFLRKLKEFRPANAFFCRLVCLFYIASSVYIAWLTMSDSFTLSIMVGGLVYVVLEIAKITKTGEGNKLALLLGFAGIIFFVLKFNSIYERLISFYIETAEDGKQLAYRERVWLHGIQAFLNSPIFGNGPGAFSGNWGAFGGAEPHNTFIYILMDFGLIGFGLFLPIFFNCWRMVRTVYASEIAAAFSALVIFCFFHSFQRMPLFWFYIYIFFSIAIAEELEQEELLVDGGKGHEDAVYT